MSTQRALIEIRTTHANGARDSIMVASAVAGVAFRSALRKAWRAKSGALVEALAAR